MKRAICILVLSGFVAVPAMADFYGTVNVTYQGYNPTWNVVLYSYGTSINTYSGMVTLDLDTPLGVPTNWAPYLSGTVEAFCIDLGDYSSGIGDTLPYDVNSLDSTPDPWAGPMGEIRAGYLAELLDTYWNEDLDTNLEKAALQLAIWEVVDESRTETDDPKSWVGLDVAKKVWDGSAWVDNPNRGEFYVAASQDVINLANSMLGSITTGTGYANKYVGLTNNDVDESKNTGRYQDWVVQVPVPGAVLLGFLGLSAAGIRLRRFA